MVEILFWAATALAVAFGLGLLARYRQQRAPFYVCWTVSFGLYAVAYSAEALSLQSHWTLLLYQFYIVASASLVGAMSAGTTYLAFSRTVGHLYTVGMAVCAAVLMGSILTAPPHLHGTWIVLNSGQGVILGLAQVMYAIMASVGGTVVLVGAVWSWWKTKRTYNLLIALGALASGVGGMLVSQGVALSVLPAWNIAGLILIFLGYLYSRSTHGGRSATLATPHG